MKMTLPFKPHVLALICSAGLCAASAGLYIKSRTVEAPVEAQSTQQTAPDISAVTLPATVSVPPVTPAVVKSTFSTAQIDQWVAPVAVPRLSAFTSVNGINLSGKRCSSSAMVTR